MSPNWKFLAFWASSGERLPIRYLEEGEIRFNETTAATSRQYQNCDCTFNKLTSPSMQQRALGNADDIPPNMVLDLVQLPSGVAAWQCHGQGLDIMT